MLRLDDGSIKLNKLNNKKSLKKRGSKHNQTLNINLLLKYFKFP